MHQTSLLDWLGGSWLGVAMRDVVWLFPTAEIAHFIGLCGLFGSMLAIDLRLLGVGRGIPISALLPVVRLALASLTIIAISGVSFFCSDPVSYWENPLFKLKLLLVFIAGVNAVWFALTQAPRVESFAADQDPGALVKASAALSLVLWTGVIILGRLLPYAGPG